MPPDPQVAAPPLPPDQRPASWDDIVRHAAEQARVPVPVALAVLQQESNRDPKAKSSAGAIGFMQLMPDTAAGLGVDPNDPVANIRGGLTYLRQRLDAHDGDLGAALADYHGGPNPQLHGPITQQYVQDVLGKLGARQQVGQAPPTQATPTPTGGAPTSSYLANKVPAAATSVGQPPPDPSQFEPSYGGLAKRAATDVATAFDPRTPTGRRNLAGTAGSVALGAATDGIGFAPGLLGMAARFAAPVLGAAAGGAAAEGGEQLVGTKPPSRGAIGGAALEQGATAAAGHALTAAVLWPFRLGATSALGKGATKALSDTWEGTASDLRAGFDSVRTAKLGQVEARTTGEPTSVEAGRAATEILKGPAKTAKDLLGQRVRASTKTGPTVDITPVKAEATRVLEQEIKPPQTAFPHEPLEPVEPAAGMEGTRALAAGEGPKAAQARDVLSQIDQQLADAQAERTKALLKHPALGTINRIRNANDAVPMEDAYLYLKELDNAVGTKWDESVGDAGTNIVKVMRGTLRDALRSANHAPYEEASAAYRPVAKLWQDKTVKGFLKVAEDDPEKLVNTIRPNAPSDAATLRELLTSQAEAGGDALLGRGQQAWDAVRAAWTKKNILRGDPQKILGKLDNLDPDFKSIFYGDASGQQVLHNLQTIAGTIQHLPAAHDITRAIGLGPRSVWGTDAIMRLLRGPSGTDLLQWAAYAPTRTKLLVRVLAGQEAPQAVSALLRADPLGLKLADAVDKAFAPPRPQDQLRPQLVGTPPPRR